MAPFKILINNVSQLELDVFKKKPSRSLRTIKAPHKTCFVSNVQHWIILCYVTKQTFPLQVMSGNIEKTSHWSIKLSAETHISITMDAKPHAITEE